MMCESKFQVNMSILTHLFCLTPHEGSSWFSIVKMKRTEKIQPNKRSGDQRPQGPQAQPSQLQEKSLQDVHRVTQSEAISN